MTDISNLTVAQVDEVLRCFGIMPSAEPRPALTGWTKVLANGAHVDGADPRTDHVAVIDHGRGLMFAVESLGNPDDADDGISHDHCVERCKELRLLGYDDWRLPTRAELAGLIDDTRHDPAIDTNLFPRVKPRWHWTSTAAAWSSASAWVVYFVLGYVNYGRRSGDGFALAVRSIGKTEVGRG